MVFVTAAAVISCAVLGAPAKDEIKEMPGWSGALPSKQYSGFLSVTDANNQVQCCNISSTPQSTLFFIIASLHSFRCCIGLHHLPSSIL